MKSEKKNIEVIIAVVIILAVIVCILGCAGYYFEKKYYRMKELASDLCELSNAELDMLKETLPYWEEAMLEHLTERNINWINITIPDPFDCVELVK